MSQLEIRRHDRFQTSICRETPTTTEEPLYQLHNIPNNLRHTYSRHPAFSSHKTISDKITKAKPTSNPPISTTMLNPTPPPTLREAAIQAAAAKNLESFSKAYTPNPTQAGYIAKAMSKACNQLARTTNVCNNGLVKQLCFIQANNKLAILSCPFPTQGPEGEAIIAGSLGDSFDVICPVTIRLRDARGLVISVVTPKSYAVEPLDLPISQSNPIEEEGPPPTDGTQPEPAGPDRIKIVIKDPDVELCFAAIPKVFPLAAGYTIPVSDETKKPITIETPTPTTDLTEFELWFEAMKYGVFNLKNQSIHHHDTLFVYDQLEKSEFKQDDLVSKFTTTVTYITQDDELYDRITANALSAKVNAINEFGSHQTITRTPPSSQDSVVSLIESPIVAPQPPVPIQPATDFTTLIEGFAKAITDSSAKGSLTSAERERASEATETKAFYEILFASCHETLAEDGSTHKVFVKATLNPQFLKGVLKAIKSSKATKSMQTIMESTMTIMSVSSDRFAAQSNVIPNTYDLPLTAALRTGNWEHQHTVLHPEGIKTHFGLHHLAPPRTWSAAYITRQEGATMLTQQEQVEEDKSKLATKTSDLYHQGLMGNIAELNEAIGNFYALMHSIIVVRDESAPVIWHEIVSFDKILRSPEGKQWAKHHRNIKEVFFNVFQDIQSTIAGFVAEARKQGYKEAIMEGRSISPLIFTLPMHQGNELRKNLQGAVLMMQAGPYKETPLTFNLFQPAPKVTEPIPRKRELHPDNNTATQPSRSKPADEKPSLTSSMKPKQVTMAPGTSYPTTQPLPGKTMFRLHKEHEDKRKLPQPGPIFPHPSKQGQYATMCLRSAYEDRTCSYTDCSHYHFPAKLSAVPKEVKAKLKEWVSSQPNVSWSAGAAEKWANPEGN
jgi:hypothetical protein